jgi:hypothetical protein
MVYRFVIKGLAVIGLLLATADFCQAGRTPTVRTPGTRSTWPKSDIRVPYLTTGSSAFMSTYVAPRIYASPIVDAPHYPEAKPVFNLIFYGSREAFGDRSNGATPRTQK